MSDVIVWHDVENGGYDADLPIWRELAQESHGPVLDLGAGTGRVALDLGERGLCIECVRADARRLDQSGPFGLVIAPMQFVQILGGPSARAGLLARAAGCLHPGGIFAAAISNLDEAVAAEDAAPPLPDVGERGGWIYTSLPLDVRPQPGGVAVEWLRQKVSPAGTLTEERHTEMLDSLDPGQLEREAAAAGLNPVSRHEVRQTEAYIGSTVVVCRR